jgi:hypothetical protein
MKVWIHGVCKPADPAPAEPTPEVLRNDPTWIPDERCPICGYIMAPANDGIRMLCITCDLGIPPADYCC